MPTDTYSGNASTTDFTITFDYTSQSFVEVRIDTGLQTQGTHYNFVDDDTIRFVTAPASGTDNVTISRNTSSTLLVDFTDGASILEADMDLVNNQIIQLAEERPNETAVNALISAAVITPSINVSTFMQGVLTQTTSNAAVTAIGASVTGALLFGAASSAAAMSVLGLTSYERVGVLSNTDEDEHQVYHGIKALAAQPNLLVNGGFDVWQTGETFTAATTPDNSDDTYLADQWIWLSAGADTADITRIAATDAPPAQATSGIQIEIETANVQWALFQPLEAEVSQPLRSKTVTVSFWAKASDVTTQLRYHLVSYAGGTADTITSDCVQTWNGAGVVPTLISGATLVEPGTVDSEEITLTGSWAEYKTAFAVPFNVDNLGVIIIADTDQAINDTISITNVKLEEGGFASSYLREPLETQVRRCQRFYAKTFDLDVVPADNAGFEGALGAQIQTWSGSPYGFSLNWILPTEMVAAPTVTPYNPDSGTAGRFSTTAAVIRGAHTTDIGAKVITFSESSATVPTPHDVYFIHAVADARL